LLCNTQPRYENEDQTGLTSLNNGLFSVNSASTNQVYANEDQLNQVYANEDQTAVDYLLHCCTGVV